MIVHITVNRPQRMNTSSIWREMRMKGRKRKGGGKRGEKKGDRHGPSLSGARG